MGERILFVDDDPSALRRVQLELRGEFDIEVAEDGPSGLQMVAEEDPPFAAVVSDLELPGMNGLGFLSKVRSLSPDTARLLRAEDVGLAAVEEALASGLVCRVFLKSGAAEQQLHDGLRTALDEHRRLKSDQAVAAEETRHILIVEDARALAMTVEFNLKRAGFDVTLAFDGEEALELVQSRCFDLIICDQHMPNLNGLEMCKKLRADEQFRDVPIVFLTAKRYELNLQQLREELGITTVVGKPFSPSKLVRLVEACLADQAATASASSSLNGFFDLWY